MNHSGAPSLFFLTFPDLRKLCLVTVSLPPDSDEGELRNRQMATCRELLFQYQDITASPVLGSFEDISVIMAISFFRSGLMQAYAQRHDLQMATPQMVLPGILQTCLSYTLTAKLAPNWNMAGGFLIAGRDFLSDSGKRTGIVMELSAREGQLCISLETSTVRLPPATLEDFDIPLSTLRNFHRFEDAVIQTFSISDNWCYVLPSMKKGQLVNIAHRVSPDCPFRSYGDMQKHWSSLYGYQLPLMDEADVVYCSVYFKMVGERLFTYPLSCIRTQPIQVFPRAGLQGALSSFLIDLRGALQSLCGFPVRMTSKPCYSTTSLMALSSQETFITKPVNLTTRTVSRPVLTKQLVRSSPPKDSSGPSSQRAYLSQPTVQSNGIQSQAASGATVTTPTSTPGSAAGSLITPSLQSQRLQSGGKIVPIFKNRALARHLSVTKVLAERLQQRGEEEPDAGPASLHRTVTLMRKQTSALNYRYAQGDLFESTPKKRKPGVQEVDVEKRKPGVQEVDVEKRKPGVQEVDVEKRKPGVQEVDVEMYARSNQLAKVNMATLQAWLRSRGVHVRSKDRKEELVTKVLHCLSEP